MADVSAGPSIDPDSLYTGVLNGGSLSPAISAVGATAVPLPAVLSNYIKIGFIHIIPRGLDHILFVLGLFFYAPAGALCFANHHFHPCPQPDLGIGVTRAVHHACSNC